MLHNKKALAFFFSPSSLLILNSGELVEVAMDLEVHLLRYLCDEVESHQTLVLWLVQAVLRAERMSRKYVTLDRV